MSENTLSPVEKLKRAGIPQRLIAERAGIRQSTVSQTLRGVTGTSLDTWLRICAASEGVLSVEDALHIPKRSDTVIDESEGASP